MFYCILYALIYILCLGANIVTGYNEGSLKVYINDLDCNGTEDSIWNCSYNTIQSYMCNHYGDAAVACSGF